MNSFRLILQNNWLFHLKVSVNLSKVWHITMAFENFIFNYTIKVLVPYFGIRALQITQNRMHSLMFLLLQQDTNQRNSKEKKKRLFIADSLRRDPEPHVWNASIQYHEMLITTIPVSGGCILWNKMNTDTQSTSSILSKPGPTSWDGITYTECGSTLLS